mgnify:CR=1 FL=1
MNGILQSGLGLVYHVEGQLNTAILSYVIYSNVCSTSVAYSTI